jgi:DeoR family glycerol-3-phosphate regulon repressor
MAARTGDTAQAGGRHERILDLVRRQGYVSIEALARHFAVTPQTVRRDINQLCEAGMLRRYHGGAGLPSSVQNLAYQARQSLLRREKQAIGRLAAAEIPDDAALFINIGTTTEEVAKALRDHRGLRVITNNIHVAATLSPNPDFEVILAGGVVRARDGGIVGEATLDLIRQFKVDFGIIGISGIDADGSLLDFDYREVRVAQAIIANSRRVLLVADHTKFGRDAMVRLGRMAQLDDLLTDREPPPDMAEMLREAGVRIHVAGMSQATPEEPAEPVTATES